MEKSFNIFSRIDQRQTFILQPSQIIPAPRVRVEILDRNKKMKSAKFEMESSQSCFHERLSPRNQEIKIIEEIKIKLLLPIKSFITNYRISLAIFGSCQDHNIYQMLEKFLEERYLHDTLNISVIYLLQFQNLITLTISMIN